MPQVVEISSEIDDTLKDVIDDVYQETGLPLTKKSLVLIAFREPLGLKALVLKNIKESIGGV